jgi:hypothetical protein
MQKIFILLTLLTLLSLSKASAQFEGTFGIGVHADYGAEINSLGIGAHLHYYRTNTLRFAPAFTYFPERRGEGMWIVDADAHYILPVSVSASLYPVAGLSYSNWTHDASKSGGLFAEDRRDHRIGATLGVGFQHDISYRLRANFELKYQFIKDYSQVVFMAGFGFWL